jgi:hypothetical protein
MDTGKLAPRGAGPQVPVMSENSEPAEASADTSTPQAPPAPPKRSFARRHWGKLTLAFILGAPAAVFALWATISLSWSYSDGQRAGYVQKMSRKGFVCKTWEGVLYTDIAKGFRSDSFSFTVRNDSLAHVIEGLSGKRVTLHYEQHIYVPSSCFGETEYFVTKAEPIPE